MSHTKTEGWISATTRNSLATHTLNNHNLRALNAEVAGMD